MGAGHRTAQGRLLALAKQSADLIQWVVFDLLKSREPKGMELIVNAAKVVKKMDIFTLNHDLLIEALLRKHNLKFSDGFEIAKNGNQGLEYNGKWKRRKINLYKLHGSIDWYLGDFKNPNATGTEHKNYSQFIKLNTSAFPLRPFTLPSGKSVKFDGNFEPKFLTGTQIKERYYNVDVFLWIFRKFIDHLEKHNTLICSGYGWGDHQINLFLKQWLRIQKKNKLIIFSEDPPKLLEAVRKVAWKVLLVNNVYN
jgi:hypothetical protein